MLHGLCFLLNAIILSTSPIRTNTLAETSKSRSGGVASNITAE